MASTKPLRLPPQPTNTALARLVRRMIDRLPGASIGAWNSLSARADRLQRQLYRADDANCQLHEELARVKTDIRRMMAPVPRPQGRIRARLDDDAWRPAPELRLSVDYEPMRFNMMLNPEELRQISRGELSPATHARLREAAHYIAQEQARHHAAEILRITLETLTKKDAANG